MRCDFAVLWFDDTDFEFVLVKNRSTSRRRIKPLVEADEWIARNIDKDCVEKRYIDEKLVIFQAASSLMGGCYSRQWQPAAE
jgi:hypothetical protein